MAEPSSDTLIELIDTLALLRDEYDVSITYAQLWAGAASGRIPATRSDRRWWVRRGDLATVAQAFAHASNRGPGRPPKAA